VADRHPDALVKALVTLAVQVTERPWSLTHADLDRARAAGLDDASVLQAVLQSSLFGHFNRIADAVGVDLDYADRFGAPHVEPATPPYLWPSSPPDPDRPREIDLTTRDGAAELAAAWQRCALERDAPLTREQRTLVAAAVAERLGDRAVMSRVSAAPVDRALVDLTDLVTLAPWRLGPTAYDPLRELGLTDDRSLFDVVATASSAGVFSRIRVALAGLSR
jgi:alkylhydroperoxidase family enzyme